MLKLGTWRESRVRGALCALMLIPVTAGGCTPVRSQPAPEVQSQETEPCAPCMESYPGGCREAHSGPSPAEEPHLVAVEGTAHFMRTLREICYEEDYDPSFGPCMSTNPTNLYVIEDAGIRRGAFSGGGERVFAIAQLYQLGVRRPGIMLEEGRRYLLFGGRSAPSDELSQEENGNTFGVRAACPL